MKAIAFNQNGGPEVLKEVKLPDPKAGIHEAVIRMDYTSVNRLDTLVRRGYPGLNITFPHIPGTDVVGRIESLGRNVSGFAKGDVVIAAPQYGCNNCEACLSGDESLCSKWGVIGRDTQGSYAEFIKLPVSLLIKPPKSFTMDELACMPLSLSTAWKALKVGLPTEGNTVVIRGATGNVGLFATLLAKEFGMNTIALTRGMIKSQRLKLLGPDLVFDTAADPNGIVDAVRDFTKGKGADIVIDSFGSTLDQSLEMLKDGGRAVVFGTITGDTATVGIKKIYLRSRRIIGVHSSNKQEFEDALNFVEEHKIKPIIGKILPIKKAADAHRMLENSEVFGKIVLKHK